MGAASRKHASAAVWPLDIPSFTPGGCGGAEWRVIGG
jgi:hypothetical protein